MQLKRQRKKIENTISKQRKYTREDSNNRENKTHQATHDR